MTPKPRNCSSRTSSRRSDGSSSETLTTPSSRGRRPRSWCSSVPPTQPRQRNRGPTLQPSTDPPTHTWTQWCVAARAVAQCLSPPARSHRPSPPHTNARAPADGDGQHDVARLVVGRSPVRLDHGFPLQGWDLDPPQLPPLYPNNPRTLALTRRRASTRRRTAALTTSGQVQETRISSARPRPRPRGST